MKLHLGQYTLDGVFLFYIQYLIEFISHLLGYHTFVTKKE